MFAAIRRASSFELNQCVPITKHLQVTVQERGSIMDTRATERVISFWVQIAPLVVLAAVVCALAAIYIW
jgi:hypothetical protein